jgi:hypothetical protein
MFCDILEITDRQGTWSALTDHRLRLSEGASSYLGLRPSSPAGVHWAVSPSNG